MTKLTFNLGIARTKEWFDKAVPEPTQKNIHTQTGVHFEEVREFVDSLYGNNAVTQHLLETTSKSLKDLAHHLKNNADVLDFNNPDETLDGILDQIVTATGVGHMLGFDVVGGLDEVNRSNFSKFVNDEPIFDENRKIKKGPDYTKPELSNFL